MAVVNMQAAEPSSLTRDSKPSLAMFSWLAGTWSFDKDGRIVTEHWFAPTTNIMVGVSQTAANGKTVEYEFVLIRQDGAGEIVYVAKPLPVSPRLLFDWFAQRRKRPSSRTQPTIFRSEFPTLCSPMAACSP